MATFKKTGQNLEYELPDVGEVFIGGEFKDGQTAQTVFRRTANGIESISTASLGGQKQGENVTEAEKRGLEILKQKGINPRQLSTTSGDILRALGEAGLVANTNNPQATPITDINAWINSQIQSGGDITGSAVTPDVLNTALANKANPTQTINPAFDINTFNQSMVNAVNPTIRQTSQPSESGLATFKYVDKSGEVQTVQAKNADEALRVAPNIASSSGVQQISDQLTGDDLAPVNDLNINQPNQTSFRSAGSINTDFIPTGASATLSETDKLISKLEGREATTAKRLNEATQGIDEEILKLNKQIKELQAQELEATNKARNLGQTTGFASGEQENVRRQFAVEALRLSATSEALQGNLALAEKKAQQSIDAEFAQVEEDLRAKRNNIIQNYDSFSNSEKKRADAILLSIDSDDEFIKQIKEERAQIFNIQQEAIKQGITNADILQRISNAPSVEQALSIMASNVPQEDKMLSVAEAKSLGVPFGTTESQAFGLMTTEGGDIRQVSSDEANLRKEFQSLPEIKQFQDITRSFSSMQQVYNEAISTGGSKASADQALVTLFNKMLDPTSVVREGEYARSFNGQSAIARVQGYVEQITKGGAGITDANRKDMVNVAERLFNDAQSKAVQTKDFYNSIASQAQLNPQNITGAVNFGQQSNLTESNIDNDIMNAIKDTANFENREQLIDALINEYGLSLQEAATKVYTTWTDNLNRN